MKTEAPAEINSLLKTMFSTSVSGLTWFLDSKQLFESIQPGTIDDILDAYHRAYHRFLAYVFGENRSSICLTDFPLANIVITEKRDIFKELYHTPHRFDQLPKWVAGYVNFKNSLYVNFFNRGKQKIEIDDDAHEFTHAFIPDALELPPEFLDSVWPTWVNEAFTVGANQRQPIEWVSQEIRNMTTPPSTTLIEEQGIFAIDQRKPRFNPAYQYCVLITEAIGNEVAHNLHPDITIPPLLAVCDLTQRIFRQGKGKTTSNFSDEVKLMGIDTGRIENQLQRSLLA